MNPVVKGKQQSSLSNGAVAHCYDLDHNKTKFWQDFAARLIDSLWLAQIFTAREMEGYLSRILRLIARPVQ